MEKIIKSPIAIGCLVQWYEADIVTSYIESLKAAVDYFKEWNPEAGDILVDFTIVTNTDLEKPDTGVQVEALAGNIIRCIVDSGLNTNIQSKTKLYTISDYRRDFNYMYCDVCDQLVWGESDMLVPREMFSIILGLHKQVTESKYICTFGTCKMWDSTWKQLEHPKFTNYAHSDSKLDWWSLNYDMTIDEMYAINDEANDIEVEIINPVKFNGCGLVISSEIIRTGLNVPSSVFFIHEDTAFMNVVKSVFPNLVQYHISNILLVHNRKHKDKRNYILGETGNTVGQKRNSNDWYRVANKLCEMNAHHLFDANYTPYTWNDVFNNLEN